MGLGRKLIDNFYKIIDNPPEFPMSYVARFKAVLLTVAKLDHNLALIAFKEASLLQKILLSITSEWLHCLGLHQEWLGCQVLDLLLRQGRGGYEFAWRECSWATFNLQERILHRPYSSRGKKARNGSRYREQVPTLAPLFLFTCLWDNREPLVLKASSSNQVDFCDYHQDVGHDTGDCRVLRCFMKKLIAYDCLNAFIAYQQRVNHQKTPY